MVLQYHQRRSNYSTPPSEFGKTYRLIQWLEERSKIGMVNQGPAQNILDQHPAANGKIVKVHKRKKRFGYLVREDPDAPPQCPSKVKRFMKYPFF